MDMSQVYASTVAWHMPGALIIFDRFHVMKLMNEKLDDLPQNQDSPTPSLRVPRRRLPPAHALLSARIKTQTYRMRPKSCRTPAALTEASTDAK